MPYRKVELPPGIPATVCDFVHGAVNLYLHDAYDMLALPQPAVGITRGCGHPIVLTLTAVIAGVSRVFFSHHAHAKPAFYDALDFYPLAKEPKRSAVARLADFKDELYQVYRNNLAHCVGLRLVPRVSPAVGWERSAFRMITKVEHARVMGNGRKHRGVSDALRAPLNDVITRPKRLPPTLRRIGKQPRQLLSVEALYWGVRVLVHNLACSVHAANADALLRGPVATPAPMTPATPVYGRVVTPSSLPTQVSSAGRSVVDSTSRAQQGDVLYPATWPKKR